MKRAEYGLSLKRAIATEMPSAPKSVASSPKFSFINQEFGKFRHMQFYCIFQ